MNVRERFDAKWTPEPFSGCWLWTASCDRYGYGQFAFPKMTKAHRVSFTLYRGQPEIGKCVLHTCDTRCCVNPAHLFLGSVADNNGDRARKERSFGKLKRAQVEAIRQSKLSCQALARAYGISASHISRIRTHIKWKHL